MTEAEARQQWDDFQVSITNTPEDDMIDFLRWLGIIADPDPIDAFLAAHPDASPRDLLVAWEAAK